MCKCNCKCKCETKFTSWFQEEYGMRDDDVVNLFKSRITCPTKIVPGTYMVLKKLHNVFRAEEVTVTGRPRPIQLGESREYSFFVPVTGLGYSTEASLGDMFNEWTVAIIPIGICGIGRGFKRLNEHQKAKMLELAKDITKDDVRLTYKQTENIMAKFLGIEQPTESIKTICGKNTCCCNH